MYMKAKERTRNESLRLSLTDPDLDDLGFCGPLNSKAVADPVFSDGIENDSDVATPGNSSPQIQRANSFTSLIGAEVNSLNLPLTILCIYTYLSLYCVDILTSHYTV